MRVGYHDAARVDRHRGGFPVHLYVRAEHGAEAVGILGGAYNAEHIADMDFGGRFRDDDFLGLGHYARNDEVAGDYVVETHQGQPVDQFVGDLNREEVGLEHRGFVFLFDFLDFVLGVDAEDALDDKHREDDADHAEGICGGIALGHEVGLFARVGDLGDGLLGGGQTRGVGDGAAHHADKGVDVVDVSEEIDAEHNQHVERDGEHGKQV